MRLGERKSGAGRKAADSIVFKADLTGIHHIGSQVAACALQAGFDRRQA